MRHLILGIAILFANACSRRPDPLTLMTPTVTEGPTPAQLSSNVALIQIGAEHEAEFGTHWVSVFYTYRHEVTPDFCRLLDKSAVMLGEGQPAGMGHGVYAGNHRTCVFMQFRTRGSGAVSL